jgi:hypothetical protein
MNGVHVVQKVETILIDDLDGGEAQSTVRFAFGGAEYEIDLSTAHAAELRQKLDTFISAGRKLNGTARRASRGSTRRGTGNGPTPSEVREWAKSQGIEVKDRGRVPEELVVKFKAATLA